MITVNPFPYHQYWPDAVTKGQGTKHALPTFVWPEQNPIGTVIYFKNNAHTSSFTYIQTRKLTTVGWHLARAFFVHHPVVGDGVRP